MNGFEALELMKKGERVRNGDKIYFLSDGKICFDSGSVKEIKCIFDFNGVYDLYEETYTGLEAIELMKEGKKVCFESVVEYKIESEMVWWFDRLNQEWNKENSFDFTRKYKISK